MYTLSVYIAGEIDLFENLDKVHITLLAASFVVSLNFIGKEFKFKNNLSRRFWPL